MTFVTTQYKIPGTLYSVYIQLKRTNSRTTYILALEFRNRQENHHTFTGGSLNEREVALQLEKLLILAQLSVRTPILEEIARKLRNEAIQISRTSSFGDKSSTIQTTEREEPDFLPGGLKSVVGKIFDKLES